MPAYVDVTRSSKTGDGTKAMLAMMGGDALAVPPFAPPFLRDGEILVSHAANILLYLGPKLGLAPGWRGRAACRTRAATDDHRLRGRSARHASPDCRRGLLPGPEGRRGGQVGRFPAEPDAEIPGVFRAGADVQSARAGADRGATASAMSTCRCSSWLPGCATRFRNRPLGWRRTIRRWGALHVAVAARPKIARYLTSERRLAFNESGVCRHYPELDLLA